MWSYASFGCEIAWKGERNPASFARKRARLGKSALRTAVNSFWFARKHMANLDVIQVLMENVVQQHFCIFRETSKSRRLAPAARKDQICRSQCNFLSKVPLWAQFYWVFLVCSQALLMFARTVYTLLKVFIRQFQLQVHIHSYYRQLL